MEAIVSNAVDFMIVGVDIFTGKGASAVQAAVFSLDRDCGKYYTYVNYMSGRNTEFVFSCETAFSEALQAYRVCFCFFSCYFSFSATQQQASVSHFSLSRWCIR